MALACAELPENAGAPTSSVAGTTSTSPNGTTPSTGPTLPPLATSTTQLVGPNAAIGLSVRWQLNQNLCIARTSAQPTLNDPIILSTCANANQQAWALRAGILMADGNLCLGASSAGQQLHLVSCTDANAQQFVFNGGSVFSRTTSNVALFADSNTAVAGSPVLLGSNASGTDLTPSNWNFAGVGSQPGALLSFSQAPNQCIYALNGNIGLATCSATNANYRWGLLSGDLSTNQNLCAIGSVPDPGLTLYPCAQVSNTSSNNQGFFIYQNFKYATYYNNSPYEMNLDANHRNVILTPISGSTPANGYLWGAFLVPKAQ